MCFINTNTATRVIASVALLTIGLALYSIARSNFLDVVLEKSGNQDAMVQSTFFQEPCTMLAP